ncbi:cobalt-factor II C(20)-methyltransferase [Clostridium sp.]|uniref:cobalt-factor II C(20)-methyltransferase n=1 Tax=Clostridium sp. TaxID=1506 RepID=UPI0026DB5AC7|nr:cobalt-factor II C(20)-methyltransferase [Clostridium sp.]MDO5038439.1 cobalt-factor II C(20)-methyltransferase [Clostridium sp.]
MAKLYGIGVGPGDSELLTIKAVNAIKQCDIIVSPVAVEGGESVAYETAKEYIGKDTEVILKHFPMGKKDRVEKAKDAYKYIENEINSGKTVGFLTIGDPYVYSTYIHMLKHMKENGIEVVTIPGVTSFCAAASLVNRTLVIGNEPLLILPAARISDIKDEKYVVIMKVYKKEEEVLNLLEEKGFDYVCVQKVGRDGERVLENRDDIINSREYMSLIIASRD